MEKMANGCEKMVKIGGSPHMGSLYVKPNADIEIALLVQMYKKGSNQPYAYMITGTVGDIYDYMEYGDNFPDLDEIFEEISDYIDKDEEPVF